jgi:hypothetical protein
MPLTASIALSRRSGGRLCVTLVCLAFALWNQAAFGQELSPRLFWPAPVGTKVLVMGYAHASGDVLMDRSIPVYGVDSEIDTALLGYVQTFNLWGRTANLLLELPYSWGSTSGRIFDIPAQRDFEGFNDPAVSMMINLVGAPALTPADFQDLRSNPRPLLGMRFKLVAPSGHYEIGRLINVGSNRWAARGDLGAVIPLHSKWLLELNAGAWVFGHDDDFVSGRREQDPIYSAELHLIRRFKPGFWASLDANYFKGGRQTVGGSQYDDVQQNTRFGATIVVPFQRRHAIKLGYSTGTQTRYGSDYSQIVVSYQVLL